MALHIFAIVCASCGPSCLISHVGAGSNEQCFAGDSFIIFVISSLETVLKTQRVSAYHVAVRLLAVNRLSTILFSQSHYGKTLQTSAERVCSLDAGTSCKSKLTFDQSVFELDMLAVIVRVQ